MRPYLYCAVSAAVFWPYQVEKNRVVGGILSGRCARRVSIYGTTVMDLNSVNRRLSDESENACRSTLPDVLCVSDVRVDKCERCQALRTVTIIADVKGHIDR